MRACMKNVSVSQTGYVSGDFFDIKDKLQTTPPQLVFQRWQDDEVDTFVGHFADCIGQTNTSTNTTTKTNTKTSSL